MIEDCAPVAYGQLGLKPSEFYALTFNELESMADGFLVRRDIKAAEIAQIVNARFRKRPISSITELTGNTEEGVKYSEEQQKKIVADFKRLKDKFGG